MFPAPVHPTIRPQVLDDLLGELERIQRIEFQLQAQRIRVLAQVEKYASAVSKHTSLSPAIAHRSTHAQVATAIRLSEVTVSNHVTDAVSLVEKYPRTLALMEASELSLRHATTISDAGQIIACPERRHQYETAVLEYAVSENVARLRPVAKKLAEAFTDIPLTERHTIARKRRYVEIRDGDDGMAELRALLPAVAAHGLFDRISRIAWKVKQAETNEATKAEATTAVAALAASTVSASTAANPTESPSAGPSATRESRSIHEIKADVLTDLLLAGTPSPQLAGKGLGAITAIIQVTTPDTTLTPASPSGVALLTSHGPIDTDSARELASHQKRWLQIHTNPSTGEFISTNTYEPSTKLRQQIRIRDLHCRFPGCRAPITRCDLDHTIDAALGGPTNTENLAHLCRWHHTLKHATDWQPKQHPGGVLKWVSPTGRTYIDRPPSRVMFKSFHPDTSIHASAVTHERALVSDGPMVLDRLSTTDPPVLRNSTVLSDTPVLRGDSGSHLGSPPHGEPDAMPF